MKKVALLDVDGVLLDLHEAMFNLCSSYFKRTIDKNEYIQMVRNYDRNTKLYTDFGRFFMHSKHFESISAFSGMKETLEQLKEYGFDLIIISACPNEDKIKSARLKNLNDCFGDIFKAIHLTGSTNKKELIAHYANRYDISFFCDDRPANVEQSIGLVNYPIWKHNSFLLPHLSKETQKDIFIAKQPEDILKIIQIPDICSHKRCIDLSGLKTNRVKD